ncbi:SUMO ligase [Achlya hypogyna]|uniref:SUMO ligase n=1 Tax=Achlya hypogyna TaxID=1202772 RepID=A0A1V9Z221_ACHHY|nr:SUMO ligase [Achlya hypogyna]
METVQIETLKGRLQCLRIPELKIIMKAMSLSSSGRKQELVDRIYDKVASYNSGLAQHASQSETHATFYKHQMAKAIAVMNQQLGIRTNEMRGHPMPERPPPVYKAPIQQPMNSHGWTPGPIPMPMPPARMNQLPFPQALAHGVVASTAPELNNARCMCPVRSGGSTTKCCACSLVVHNKCHGLPVESTDWHCEACRSKVFDPFFKVIATYGSPFFARFNVPRPQSFLFELSHQDVDMLRQTRGTGPGATELQLRCFALCHGLSEGHSWPTTSQISVNGYAVQLVQRANPGQTNVSKVLRELPLNLGQHCRPGRNVVEIRGNDQHGMLYAFLVQRVARESLDSLVAVVQANSRHVTYDSAKQNVIASFGDDDDDIVATCTMLSVRCPLGLSVIELPARGVHCQHLQCFDLKTFLMFNKSARSRAWKCIVCHKFIALNDLRIDPFLKALLAQVADDEELEEVEIFPDATWKKRVDEEAEAKAKKPKVEEAEAVDVAAPVDSIDLTLSSDDEAEAPTPAWRPPPRPAGMDAMTALWAPLPSPTWPAESPFRLPDAHPLDLALDMLPLPSDMWAPAPQPTFAGTSAAAIDVLSSPVAQPARSADIVLVPPPAACSADEVLAAPQALPPMARSSDIVFAPPDTVAPVARSSDIVLAPSEAAGHSADIILAPPETTTTMAPSANSVLPALVAATATARSADIVLPPYETQSSDVVAAPASAMSHSADIVLAPAASPEARSADIVLAPEASPVGPAPARSFFETTMRTPPPQLTPSPRTTTPVVSPLPAIASLLDDEEDSLSPPLAVWPRTAASASRPHRRRLMRGDHLARPASSSGSSSNALPEIICLDDDSD